MENLPDLPLLKIADYLAPEEIARLSLTCKRFYDILPRFLRICGDDFELVGPRTGNLVPEPYFEGPVMKSAVKSMSSSVYWHDQGYGNRKGRIIVQLMRPVVSRNILFKKKKDIKCLGEKSLFGIAEHEEKSSTCLLSDDPVVTLSQPGDYYIFLRDPGGGGGHVLYVKNFTVLLELLK